MRRRLQLWGKAALLAAIFVLAAASAGAVWAYFKSAGSGTGAATVGTLLPLTFTPGIASSSLYPDGSADVALSVSNPNGGPVSLPSIELDTSQGTNGFSVDAGHAACGVSALSFTTATTGWTVPASASAYPIDLSGAVSMQDTAASACQGVHFTVYLKVGP